MSILCVFANEHLEAIERRKWLQPGQAQDIGVFLLFGAANTLVFLHDSETLGHIGTV